MVSVRHLHSWVRIDIVALGGIFFTLVNNSFFSRPRPSHICLYLMMNIILLFHLINGIQLLYGLLKVVLQGGEEVSVSGSEHIKR